MRKLNELYKLLWEQIKDSNFFISTSITSYMEITKIITREEEDLIDSHICQFYDGIETQKEFLQRMILETTPVITD